jgi:ABC-type phosphate/phosphonate transport system substrate-binding protein
MYPFETWRAATDAFWHDVRSAMPDLPPLAPWGADVHALWHDPDLIVSQACGWPLITELAGRVRTVGAFRYRTTDWSGDHYRSVVVARAGDDQLDPATARAAVNSTDSLSGWVSLTWFAAEAGGSRRLASTSITGSHLASLAAVRDGAADIASIDAVTYAHAVRDRPELVRGLVPIGHGPTVPCLPVIAATDADDAWIAAVGVALDAAASRRSEATATLMIEGFTPLDADPYRALAVFAPAPD